MKTRKPTSLLLLFCVVLVVNNRLYAQYPKIEIEQKTNLSYLTCLDNFTLEARQINWQPFNFYEQEFLFHQINFTTPDSGFALAMIQGAGENEFYKVVPSAYAVKSNLYPTTPDVNGCNLPDLN